MSKRRTFFLALSFLALAAGLAVLCFLALQRLNDRVPSPRFTISKETTYVTGPLDEHGYIDYEAALNDALSKGVAPAGNANVLIWKAIGPYRRPSPTQTEYFRRLGVERPPEGGNYFIALDDHVWSRRPLPAGEPASGKAIKQARQALDRVTRRSWTAKEEQLIADWLEANNTPLGVFIEASQRPDYYNPMVAYQHEKGPCGLMGANLTNAVGCREAANALAARALLRGNEGKIDQAWQDLLACFRLGRLTARGGCLLETMIGLYIDQTAGAACLAFLDRASLPAEQARSFLRDLERLPALPALADKVDLTERLLFLQTVVLLNRYGLDSLEDVRKGAPPWESSTGSWFTWDRMDWDATLAAGNRVFDRAVALLRNADYLERAKQLDQFVKHLETLKSSPPERGPADLVRRMRQTDLAGSPTAGDALVAFYFPDIRKVQRWADRAEQRQRNLRLAFALAAYRSEHGRYPDALDLLAPMYLKEVLSDLYSGAGLHYHPAEDGYLLFSMGDGKDDRGGSAGKEPPADLLRIRMPLPELQPE